MAKGRAYRVMVSLDPSMRVALEILSSKSGLALSTEAMVRLRQALLPTINSEACQLRLRQDAAFRTRDQWLHDVQSETYVANAVLAAEGESDDACPRQP